MANATPLKSSDPLNAAIGVGACTAAVLHHAVDELRQAREMAERDLQTAIAGFRDIFVNLPAEGRSAPLLRQAWAVHQALEVVRSLDGALSHLQPEASPPENPLAA